MTNAKASPAKEANLYRTWEPQHKVADTVLLFAKKININNISHKIKPLWIGPFTILLPNYNCHNYSLDLSTDLSLNLIYNTFHISKIKPYVNNIYILFPQRQQEKPGPVSQDSYEVDKAIEY